MARGDADHRDPGGTDLAARHSQPERDPACRPDGRLAIDGADESVDLPVLAVEVELGVVEFLAERRLDRLEEGAQRVAVVRRLAQLDRRLVMHGGIVPP